MNKQPRTVVSNIVDFVALTERRRLLVVLGVPIVFVVLLDLVANYGVLIPFLGVGMAIVLYTRSTAQQTIAASAWGIGVLLAILFVLDLYLNVATGSTEPLIDTARRVLWRALTGVALVGLGLWLRQADL
jgi:hypothetical protein